MQKAFHITVPRVVEVETLRLPDGVLILFPDLGYQYGGREYQHPMRFVPAMRVESDEHCERMGNGRIYVADACEKAIVTLDYGNSGVVEIDLLEVI